MAFGNDRSRFVDSDFSGKRYTVHIVIHSISITASLFFMYTRKNPLACHDITVYA